LDVTAKNPAILGCGSVVFPAQDCQNQQRAGFRRQRRNIAARRNRIQRLEDYFRVSGLLREVDIQESRRRPHPWPWLLAAQVLVNGKLLTASELWSVIRWYAHNRGYDGNALWASEDADGDDVKKVQAARALMDKCGTETMCETVCALLDTNPNLNQNPKPRHYFKGENAAFPRATVLSETRKVLSAHVGQLAGVTEEFIEILLDDWKVAKIQGFDAKLPQRYFGGLLFGQMKPRFENRIIPKCRITGEKTPSKHTREFYRYRWAMFMNNLRVNDIMTGLSRPLDAGERSKLCDIMQGVGYFTKTTLNKALVKQLKLEPANLEGMLLVPEMENALTLDPALREVSTNRILKEVWPSLAESWKPIFLNQLFRQNNYRGAPPSLHQWRERLQFDGHEVAEYDAAIKTAFDAELARLAQKNLSISYEQFTHRPIRLNTKHVASGRAPYAKKKLVEAVETVMQGDDPRVVGGPLEETFEVRSRQRDGEIDQNSNNHLVRHRVKIFTRTLKDLVQKYADGDASRVEWVGVEVVRDLVQFSGKTAKEKAQIIGGQLAHHRKIVKYLEEERENTGGDWEIGAGLIKKVRIADDMGWRCPYTGKVYSLNEIIHGEVDREHIIPRSSRPTDALHALTLTFSRINKEKGARTAMQYIEDTANESHTFSPKEYREFVTKLKNKNGPSKDDESRCKKRKIALLTRDFEKRGKVKKNEGEEAVEAFTDGSLSQTSYLNKLAAQQAHQWFAEQLGDEAKLPPVVQLSGSVTAATRLGWDLFGQLNEACPSTINKNKTEVREITHLHHALDAIVIGLSAHYFPKDGRLWALLSRRSVKNPVDQAYMKSQLGDLIHFNSNGNWQLEELDAEIKKQVTTRLLEKRVVQHIPHTMRGLSIKETNWGYLGKDAEGWHWAQKKEPRDEDGKRAITKKKFGDASLFGVGFPSNGKLEKIKAVREYDQNFGAFLCETPVVIQRDQVFKRIKALKNEFGNLQILHPGSVVKIKGHKKNDGVYRVKGFSTNQKWGARVSLVPLDWVGGVKSKLDGHWENANLKSILPMLTVIELDYSGTAK